MPKDITQSEALAHFPMGLYDNWEDEVHLPIIAERIIDITDICEETQRTIGQTVIKYGYAKRGIIAQLQDRYEPGVDSGATVHYFPEEKGVAGLATDEVMLARARILGCDSLKLAETIIEFLPTTKIG